MGLKTKLVCLVAVACWARLGAPTGAATAMIPMFCADACDTSTDCTTECYIDQAAFDNGDSTTCLAFGVYSSPCCGDGVCDAPNGEACDTCEVDCGVCSIPPPRGHEVCEAD